jgi:hypothetical protein
MLSCLLASVDVIEFQKNEEYSNLELTKAQYSMYKNFREENLKVMDQLFPTSFMHPENI